MELFIHVLCAAAMADAWVVPERMRLSDWEFFMEFVTRDHSW